VVEYSPLLESASLSAKHDVAPTLARRS
jgi:hypothetical protein